MKTKKSLNFLFLMLVGTIVFSCVENYQEANPPRLKDAPAVASVTSSASQIFDGASDLITINVVDAPAGIDSIGYSITDEQGDMSGTVSFNNLATLKGKTKGEVLATYTSEKNKAVTVTLTFTVFDKQISEGKVVRKSSVPQSMVIEVICPSDLAGTYTTVTSGTSSDPGANMQTVTNLASQVTLMATSTP